MCCLLSSAAEIGRSCRESTSVISGAEAFLHAPLHVAPAAPGPGNDLAPAIFLKEGKSVK